MCVKKNEDFRYISGERYLVEIFLDGREKKYYTKRIRRVDTAIKVKVRCNRMRGCVAAVIDTKEGIIF